MSDLPTRSRLLALSQWYEGPGMGMDKRVASVLGAYADGELMTRAEWEASISGPLYRPGPKFDHPVLQRELRDIVAHGGLLEEDS